MRALLNGESLLSFFGLPSKSLTQSSNNYVMSTQPFIQCRVYSKGKYPRHPAKDIIDAIKKAQEIKHLKNGTLFKTEKPQHPFEYQTIAFAKQIGPEPPKKNGGQKADPPGFCDPPRKGAPCVLRPGNSNKVLQTSSNKENIKPFAKKTTPSATGKPEAPKAPKKNPNEKRLDNKLSADKKKPLKKPLQHDINMVAKKSNPSKKQEAPQAAKKNTNGKGLQTDKIVAEKSNAPGKSELPAKKEANGKGIQHDKICPLKSASLQDMNMVADKSEPPGKPEHPKIAKKESSGKDKMGSLKSPSQHDTSIVAEKSNPGKAEPQKAVKKESSGKDKRGPLKSPSQQETNIVAKKSNPPGKPELPAKKEANGKGIQHDKICPLKSPSLQDMNMVAEKSEPPGKPEHPKIAKKESSGKDKMGSLKSPSQHDTSIVAEKSNPGKAEPQKAVNKKSSGKDKIGPLKSPSQHDMKSASSNNPSDPGQIKSGLRSLPTRSEVAASKKVESPARKTILNAKPIPIIPGFPSGKFPCLNKTTDKKQESDDDSKSFNKGGKTAEKNGAETPKEDKCDDIKSKKDPTNDEKMSKKSKDPHIPPKQTADGKIYRSPIEEKAKLKQVQNASDSKTMSSSKHREGEDLIKKAHPKSEARKSALEDPNSKSKIADCSAKSSKPSITSSQEAESGEENERQHLLPYPVTPLKETLDRYLCSVKPLLEDDMFNLEQQLVKEFLDNDGAKLQAFLEKEATRKANWLTERWTNAAYLEVRTPLTIYTSPCLAFPLQKFLHPIDYITFVAKCIYGMLEFKKMVDEHKIPVVKMCQYELDNSQFGKIFGGVRVPLPCMDQIEQYSDSDYVIVINKNNFYKLPVYNVNGKIAHAHALRDQLDGIINGPNEHGDTIGLLTHDTRDNWAEVHEILMRDKSTCHILSVIEKALFAVCLDEYVDLPPEGEQRNLQAAHLLHGGGRHLNSANRWMDKTLQLIVNPNGFSGFCFEHSPADCQPLAMLMDLLQKNIRQPGYGCESCNDGKVEPFTPLIFKPLSECTELWMSVAQRNIDSLCKHFQLNVFKFHCHGKNFIMAQGLNTDSYIQIALQLAFFLIHKEMPSQYESAHLRIFEGGRTETIRSTTIESSAFIKSMTLPNSSKKDRMEALRAAVDAHQELTKLALLGRGVDRHLFGLQQMAKENGLPLPEFFKSPGYLKSINYRVLSSQVATTHDAFLAFGPLTTCGYGCCYNPRNNDIIFSISNWNIHKKTSAEVYGQAINTALHHMRKLVLETGGDRGSAELCKCDGKTDKK